jgi:glycosyltransferase involved in cell wall biosynthesis
MSQNNLSKEEKRRVLFVAGSLPGGGAERILIYLLKKLNRNKYDISLCLFKKKGVFCSEIPKDIFVCDLNKKTAKDTFGIIYKLAVNVYPSVKPDIVVSVLEYPNILSLIAKFFSSQKPKLVFVEQIYPVNFWAYKGERLKKLIERIAAVIFYRFADKIIAISSIVKKGLIKRLLIPNRIISVIHDGVDIKEIRSKSKDPIAEKELFKNNIFSIIACGRLVSQKNYPLLLKAFHLVAKKHNVQLLILGEGRQRGNILNLINRLRLSDKVFLLGFKNNPFAYLSRADIYVLSSNFEGLSVALLEAMACKKAVISTYCQGPSEVVKDNIDGLLVKRNDAQALSQAIEKLIADETLRNRLAAAAVKKADLFDVDRIVKTYERVLDSL